jgi:hypothetical protein
MSETEQPDHPAPPPPPPAPDPHPVQPPPPPPPHTPPPPQQAGPAGRVHVLAPGEVVITGLGAG